MNDQPEQNSGASRFADLVDEVVYINLDERADKRDAMERQFRSLGIKARRFSAILASRPLHGPQQTPFLGAKKQQELPRSGCDQSHWTVLTELWKSEAKTAIVFEDDAILPTDFCRKVATLIEELNEKASDWWAVRIGWHDGLGKKTFGRPHRGFCKVKKPSCTNAILYSERGIEQIRRRMMVPYGIIEETFWVLEETGEYPIYAAWPVPITRISDHTSDITGKRSPKGSNNSTKAGFATPKPKPLPRRVNPLEALVRPPQQRQRATHAINPLKS